MSDVRTFPGVKDIQSNASNPMVEDVLAGAIEFEKVLVIGITHDNKFSVAFSHPDLCEAVYLLVKAQKMVMEQA